MEKQIEEIGRYMAKVSHSECALKMCEDCKWCGEGDGKADCMDYLIAEHLYNAGYRKLNEGEWEEPPFVVEIISSSDENYLDKLNEKKYEANNPYRCGVCKGRTKTKTKFCPNCGANMKGE